MISSVEQINVIGKCGRASGIIIKRIRALECTGFGESACRSRRTSVYRVEREHGGLSVLGGGEVECRPNHR